MLFRSEQWFVAVEKPAAADGRSLVRMALDATGDDVRFIPQWGKNRMRGMLESRPDWCLSRQRAWGLTSKFAPPWPLQSGSPIDRR